MSTANCAPCWTGRPDATTSISRSSVTETYTFMSRNFTLRVTVAPASRHTRANVLSVGTARLFNPPECGQTARCLPKMSFWPPHSHLASVKSNGKRKFHSTSVRKCMGCTWNSGPVGEPWKTAPTPGPLGQSGTASEPGRWRMTGEHYGLPKVVFGSGRRAVLPAMLPFTRVCGEWRGWSCPGPQLLPTWPADETFSFQKRARHLQLAEASLWFSSQLCKNFLRRSRRSWGSGTASAHDAQQAPHPVRAAERRPNPPND